MKHKKAFLIIGIAFMAAALIIMLYPTVSNAVNSYFNGRTIISYDKNVSNLSAAEISEYFSAAEEYNEKLWDKVGSFSYSADSYVGGYDNILNFDGIIGYIKIPKINVNLPVYHGSDEDVLTKGAAHIPNTAFPIGGDGNHSVLSAHTGYPGKVFFDNLDELENGDIISICILDRTLDYEVIGSNIVNPDDISLLDVDEDRDLLSLITCYPYGVNSHRLIVTAKRICSGETNSKDQQENTNEPQHNIFILFWITFGIAVVVCISILLIKRKKASLRGTDERNDFYKEKN